MSKKVEASVIYRHGRPDEWVVEAINTDDDGGCEITLFSGPEAEKRAREYAAWKY